MWKCISNLTVDSPTVDCWSSPPESTLNSWSTDQHCWSLITSLLTIDPLTVSIIMNIKCTLMGWQVKCSPPRLWTCGQCISNLTVDPLTVDHRPSHCWLLIVNHLTVDHWPSHCWLLIVDHLTVDCQPSHCWLLIIDCLTVDCWSSPHEISVPPKTFRAKHGLATSSKYKLKGNECCQWLWSQIEMYVFFPVKNNFQVFLSLYKRVYHFLYLSIQILYIGLIWKN